MDTTTATSSAAISAREVQLPGGRYQAQQAADGTWEIQDVPIFAEVPEGSRKNSEHIGREWMEQAVLRASARAEDDNYLAPLHVLHHDPGVKPEFAGFVVPRRVGKMRYEGRSVWAVYADFKRVPDAVYQRIRRGELPYRSVEILDYEKPEISSLALLDTEVPYFRLPMLTIGDEVSIPDGVPAYLSVRTYEDSPVESAVWTHHGAGGVHKFSFRESHMSEPDKLMQQPPGQAPQAQPQAPAPSQPAADPMTGALAEIKQMLASILEAISVQNDAGLAMSAKKAEAEDEGDEVEVTVDVDDDDDDEGEKKKGGGKMSAKRDQLEASDIPDSKEEKSSEDMTAAVHLAALEAKDRMREKRDEVTSLVCSVAKELRSDGYEVDETTEAQMVTFAAKGGEALLGKFAEEIKRLVPRDPPQDIEADAGVGDASYPPEVMKYSEQSPEAFAAAKSHYATWRQVTQMRSFRDLDLGRYLERRVKVGG